MEKLTVSAAQKILINLVKLVTEEGKVYQIEIDSNSAVLISHKDYESLQETLELLSVPGLRESRQEIGTADQGFALKGRGQRAEETTYFLLLP